MGKKVKQQDRSTLYVVIGTIVFALILMFVVIVTAQQQKSKPASADLVVGADPHVRGAEQAQVTLSVFFDFTCSHCRDFSKEVDSLLATFPGSLKVVERYFPLAGTTSPSILAMQANEAAGAQGNYWEYQTLLWDNYGKIAREDLLTFARTLGLDMDKFTSDLDSEVYRDRVLQDHNDGKALGVAGTPAIYINGKKHTGSYAIAPLTTAIQDELDSLNQTN